MRRTIKVQYRMTRNNLFSRIKLRLGRFMIYWRNIQDIFFGLLKDYWWSFNSSAQSRVKLVWPVDGNIVLAANRKKRWCFYASYSPQSIVSDMVLKQLDIYREYGFTVVFIAMSEKVSDETMTKLRPFADVIIHRKSFGRDFGAWKDATETFAKELEAVESVLFTNDAQLGPIYPLEPWLDDCTKEDGCFGLTESIQGGVHLQSYFLTANGRPAVQAALAFLKALKLSHSKWIMVQRGELAFTEAMMIRGHFTAAAVDYEMLENAVLEDILIRKELESMFPKKFAKLDFDGSGADRYKLRRLLFALPLNPTHQLSNALIKKFQFPFIKAELVLKNPGLVPTAPDWRYSITDDSPVSERMIDDHLFAQIKY